MLPKREPSGTRGENEPGLVRRPEVATLGEALIVLDPASPGSLRHIDTLYKRVGGAELNVAVALARLGHQASWTGKLGEDEFGSEILAFLRGDGVDVSGATLDPDAPTGIYFKERRALDKLNVYYYRADSAASKTRFEELDLDRLLSADILHLTGITPAISESCHELTRRLMEEANKRGVVVSFDANVRFGLFGARDPKEVLLSLVEQAEFLFLSDEEAKLLFDYNEPETIRQSGRDLRCGTIIVHGADGAFAVEEENLVERPAYPVEAVDTVGAGDAFVAGFLSGRLRKWDLGQSLELANACGACAVTVPGDAESMPFEEEVLDLVRGIQQAER